MNKIMPDSNQDSSSNPTTGLELEALLRQQADLSARILALQQQERETKRLAEVARLEKERLAKLEKGLVITMTSFQNGYLTTESDYNHELLSAFRALPSRRFMGGNGNMFHVKDLDQFNQAINHIAANTKITIEWKDGVKEATDKWLNTPPFHIYKSHKQFEIVLGPAATAYGFNNLPGIKWEKDKWTLPLSEGWRLLACLKDSKPVYEKDALEFIENQVNARERLGVIANLPDIKYDPWFKNGRKLRNFQRVGAAFIEAAGGNAVEGDQTGLGKTWQALAYAWKNKLKTVIVPPAKLKSNWFQEIMDLTGQTATIMQGSAPSDNDILKLFIDKPQFIICNYDILGRVFKKETVTRDEEGYLHKKVEDKWLWVELINLYEPDLIIFDEGHYLQNHDSQRSVASRLLKAPRRLVMTATPMLNNPANLWPILTLVKPDLFPSQGAFLAKYTTDGKHARNIEELRDILKSVMIRRMKKDVQKDLPEIIPIKNYETLSPKAKKLYQRVLEGVYQIVAEWNPSQAGHEKKVTNILTQIMRLKQICAISKIESTADDAVELYDSSEGNDTRKVIIFSQFVPIVHSIAKRLGQEAITITGEQPVYDRMQLVKQFQNDPSIHFAVCSSKAVGEGLTMTQAGSIIFHDLLWTPGAHDQLIGRAYGRLNDAHGVDVHYAIIEDSIEEWILKLLDEKRTASDAIVDGVGLGDTGSSVAMDLIRKIKNSL